MARMIPDHLRPDTKSNAERKLYAAFRDQLPESYTVFHQVPWQVRDQRTGVRDGEVDFIIAHPDQGILVLEVKGGRISRAGTSGQWFSNQIPIKDPFQQIQDSKYNLLGFLKQRKYWRGWRFTLGDAVAFPDVAVSREALGLDAPRSVILDQSDMSDLLSWVERAFIYAGGQNLSEGAPRQPGIADLVELFSPSFELRPLLGLEIAEEEQEFVRLTDTQFAILYALSSQRQVAISGCAGSGKTLLAAEKARRLSQQDFKVLLVCFNVNLALFLQASLTDYPNIYVTHFHGLCRDLARQAGISIDEREPVAQTFYDEILPERLVSAADKLGWQVDAIIADEGQDFRENWWLALKCLLKDPDNGIFYIFHDDNQNLYQTGQQIPLEHLPIPLQDNCRNTKLIHTFVHQFYRGQGDIRARGPAGREVELVRYSDSQELRRHLRKQLHHLIQEEGVDASEIVVLTPHAHEKSALWGMNPLGNFRLVDHPGASSEVYCTTIHQFKGLESSVIILAEIEPDDVENIANLLYVGASRARSHLVALARYDVNW